METSGSVLFMEELPHMFKPTTIHVVWQGD